MKKLMLFGLGVVASLSVFTSCKKDEVVLENPKITFADGESIKVSDTTNSYVIKANIEAAGELKEIKILDANLAEEPQITLPITTFDTKTTHTLNFIYDLKDKKGEFKIKVSVIDGKGQTNSAIFTIKKYGSIVSYSTKIMGAQFNNAIGSFLSTSNGTIYSKTDAKSNSSLIDFVYSYRGGNYLAFIAAPSDVLLDPTVNIKAENWTKYNSTKFKLSSLTTSDFDAITDDSNFSFDSQLTETNVLSLNVGNVVYFKTEAGKLGVFKVKAINEGTQGGDAIQKFQDGSIEIDVKVQK